MAYTADLAPADSFSAPGAVTVFVSFVFSGNLTADSIVMAAVAALAAVPVEGADFEEDIAPKPFPDEASAYMVPKRSMVSECTSSSGASIRANPFPSGVISMIRPPGDVPARMLLLLSRARHIT